MSCNIEQESPSVDLWSEVVCRLESAMGSSESAWFNYLCFQGITGDTINLLAPTRFIREWVLSNYYNRLKDVVSACNPQVKKIDIRVKVATAVAKVEEAVVDAADDHCNSLRHSLDPNYLFANFVVGDANRLAYAAASSVACAGASNDLARGVLYINGPVGMGKTHLLQAIAHQAQSLSTPLKALYLTAEKFMHYYVGAVKANNCHLFKAALRSVDILLVDDIQFICGKVGTQQEFANTLNAIIEAGKMMVVSSDRSPYSLNLETRTTSRLTGGLVVDISRPTASLRRAILESKAGKIEMAIHDEILQFVAENVTSSIRELEAALNKLVASARLANHKIDLKLTKEILQDCLLAHGSAVSIDNILEVVSGYYGLSVPEVTSKSRSPKTLLSRQVAYFLAKELTDHSLQEIGCKIGKRAHATVIYSLKKLEQRLAVDSTMLAEVNKIKNFLSY